MFIVVMMFVVLVSIVVTMIVTVVFIVVPILMSVAAPATRVLQAIAIVPGLRAIVAMACHIFIEPSTRTFQALFARVVWACKGGTGGYCEQSH